MRRTPRVVPSARLRPTSAAEAVEFEPLGESMLLVRFGDAIDVDTTQRVHAAAKVLRAAALPGLHDLVPAYASLGVAFDASTWDDGRKPPWCNLVVRIEALLERAATDAGAEAAACITIPVCYGGAHGADLAAVAAHAGITIDEVVARHCAVVYRVALLGFAPGFAYLLGLDPLLHMPRRAEPRLRVPAGSVAIGGAQTGIYPRELPGGWQLLGRTPLHLFDASAASPALLAPGDRVRFVAIDAARFDTWPRSGGAA
ncbi:MAG: 5-oxoprolinase subunit PxpB [Xanthomonadales bacterium]|nr:5-oxoprolinase subunit PxpB [Xanthomonadales bacterium]